MTSLRTASRHLPFSFPLPFSLPLSPPPPPFPALLTRHNQHLRHDRQLKQLLPLLGRQRRPDLALQHAVPPGAWYSRQYTHARLVQLAYRLEVRYKGAVQLAGQLLRVELRRLDLQGRVQGEGN